MLVFWRENPRYTSVGDNAPICCLPNAKKTHKEEDSSHSNLLLILAPRYPSEKWRKERQKKKRIFLDKWEAEYLFTYVRQTCLFYTYRRHETKHQDKYKDMDMTERSKKVEEM